MSDPYVYVIMPISADPDYKNKRQRLSHAADCSKLQVHFPIDGGVDESGDFDFERTLESLSDAAGVFADLSFARPSCYYELGLAQALRKRTVLIARSGTHIHQAYGRSSLQEYVSLDDYEQLALGALATLRP